MPAVELRWRPSGGRGEYEHVPSEVLLDRNILIEPLSVPGALLRTDAWGKIRDGKPRIRRENPFDRTILNVPNLIAALALLPDPIRENKGGVILPLRDKQYVISAISFAVRSGGTESAICTPQRLRILNDGNEIDVADRLMRIGHFLDRADLDLSARQLAHQYQRIARGGVPHSELREIATELIAWLGRNPAEREMIEAPSDSFLKAPSLNDTTSLIMLETLSADETRRRLVSHYKIDRNNRIRKAKIREFESAYGSIFCENCAFNFEHKYGERGQGFIEVHHLLQLAALLPNSVTCLTDLMLLCSNCHRMVHRRQPLLGKSDLREITRP